MPENESEQPVLGWNTSIVPRPINSSSKFNARDLVLNTKTRIGLTDDLMWL